MTIAVSTPGGVVFRDFPDTNAPTVADVSAEALAYEQAQRPRCPTARQLLPHPQPAPADTKESGHGQG